MMYRKDQHTLAKAIIAQAVRDLHSRSSQQQVSARRFLQPSARLLALASIAGLRASRLLVVVRRSAR